METIAIKVRLDPAYRQRAENAGVNFGDYLTGVVIESLLKNGTFDQLLRRIDTGSVAAKAKMSSTEGIGRTMREVIDQEVDT